MTDDEELMAIAHQSNTIDTISDQESDQAMIEQIKNGSNNIINAPQINQEIDDLETFGLLGGLINSHSQSINNDMASVGSHDGHRTTIKPLTEAEAYKVGDPKASSDEGVYNEIKRPNINHNIATPQIQPQQPVYQQPQIQPQQPVYQQPQVNQQPIQDINTIFTPNLQSIILSKILAIEKNNAKIIETQKQILLKLK